MKRAILYTLLTLILPLLLGAGEAVAQQKGALLHSPLTEYDFGDVNRREGEIHHIFFIENCGDEPLIITSIIASCSCMKHSISRKPIAVGERRELRLTYELKKIPPGRFSKSVVVHSTSSDGVPTSFTLSGRSSYTSRKEYKGKE